MPDNIPGFTPFDPNNPQDVTVKGSDLLAIFNMLSPKWQAVFAAAIGVVGLLLGFIGGHNTPRPTQPVEVKMPTVNVPMTEIQPAVVSKTVYCVTTATDLNLLKTLPSGAVEMYAVGSQYNFKGTILAMPVQVTRDDKGNDTEVKQLK